MNTGAIIWLLIIGAAVLLVLAIVNGWFSGKSAGPAPLSAFHDFQPKDKQEAIEVIVEEKAGKKQFEQTSGDSPKSAQERKTLK